MMTLEYELSSRDLSEGSVKSVYLVLSVLWTPERLLVFLLQLLQVGGAEVELGAGGTRVLVLAGLWALGRSGLEAERRQI